MRLDGIVIRLRNCYIRCTAARRRKKITCSDFTIISNNCWGGIVYNSYNLPKQSPTVGMYFMAEEYLRFVSNLKYYIGQCKLEFIEPEQARHRAFYAKDKCFGSFPIARLGDVEIAMLHFHSEDEARAKWERRCARINWDKLIVKMNDQNECTAEHARSFGDLPYSNKVFFTVQGFDAGNCTVRLPKGLATTVMLEPFGASKYCNVNNMINGL